MAVWEAVRALGIQDTNVGRIADRINQESAKLAEGEKIEVVPIGVDPIDDGDAFLNVLILIGVPAIQKTALVNSCLNVRGV